MLERPNSSSLATYERMLNYHGAVALGLEATLKSDDDEANFGHVERCVFELLEAARRSERVAAKLIEAWHRDMTAHSGWQEVEEAKRRARFTRR